MSRRQAIAGAAWCAIASSCGGPEPQRPAAAPQPGKGPVILLRSGWGKDRVESAGITAGMLRLLQLYVAEAEVAVWPDSPAPGVREMLARSFPAAAYLSSEAEVAAAIARSGFLLHGSGRGVRGQGDLEAWRKKTWKPYGVFGQTVEGVDAKLRDVLAGAAFVFARETASLEKLKGTGIARIQSGVAPDAAFSAKLANEPAAVAFLRASALATKRFVAAASAREPFGEGLRMWVRATGGKVLLWDAPDEPLPEVLKPAVVQRKDPWLPDEAASVFRRAAAVLSAEPHSPILAAVNDTPGLYVHRREDEIQGRMWKDVGLGRWLFDAEKSPGRQVGEALLAITKDPLAAEADTHEAVTYARKLQSDAMDAVRRAVMQPAGERPRR